MASPKTCARNSNSGFSLLEMCIVLGMLLIVGTLGLSMSMESLRGGSFRNDRDTAIAALQRARSLAVNNMCFGGDALCADGKPHGVYFDPAANGVVIFQIPQGKTNFNERDDEVDEFIAFDSRATKVDYEKMMIFDRLSGDLITEGSATSTSVTLSDGAGRESVIKVNSVGQIDWTN